MAMRVESFIGAEVRVIADSSAGQIMEDVMLKGSMMARSTQTEGIWIANKPRSEVKMHAVNMEPNSRRGPSFSEKRPAASAIKMYANPHADDSHRRVAGGTRRTSSA